MGICIPSQREGTTASGYAPPQAPTGNPPSLMNRGITVITPIHLGLFKQKLVLTMSVTNYQSRASIPKPLNSAKISYTFTLVARVTNLHRRFKLVGNHGSLGLPSDDVGLLFSNTEQYPGRGEGSGQFRGNDHSKTRFLRRREN